MSDDLRPKERKEWVEAFRKVKPTAAPERKRSGNAGSRTANPISGRRGSVEAGLELYAGPWEEAQQLHLLRRTLFGVRKSDIAWLQTLNLTEALDQILSPSPTPPPPVNDYNGADNGTVDPHTPFGQTWTTAPYANQYESYRLASLKGWLLNNMINQEPTIHEKMIFFWHNLLVTQSWEVFISKASYQYFHMLRHHALGNYKALIKAVTIDSSMLLYLNGASNRKEAPDENYGRELQELFCIGKGPGSGYTEGDVRAAARVLTGWSINWETFAAQSPLTSGFFHENHETADKQFSEFYNNRIIQGKAGDDGALELDELIDMIFDTQESALYICRRLYSFFVFSEIDETAEQNVIVPLAEIFRSNNYEILPVLKALLGSAHFFDELNRGALIKSPVDHAIGVWKTLGMKSPNPSDLLLSYRIHNSLLWHMATLGLEMGDPPNVAGWPSYYQAPQYDQAWITTATITTRAITTDSMIYWGFWVSQSLQIKVDLIEFVKTLEQPSDPAALLKEASSLLLGMEPSEKALGGLKSILLSGQQADHYWTFAWQNYLTTPSEENRLIIYTRLQATFQRLLQLGEYQMT